MLRVVVGSLEVVERGRKRQGREAGRAVELEPDARRHAAAPHMAQRAHELGIEPARLHQLEQAAARIDTAHHRRCLELAAILQHHAGDRAAAYRDAHQLGLLQLDPRQPAQQLDDVGARRPENPGRAADVMVQEAERGAARARALQQVQHAGGAERALQRIVLEPVVEQLRHRHRQDAQQVREAALAEPPRAQREARAQRVRRRRRVDRFEEARETRHALAELRPARRVVLAHAADRLHAARHVAPQLEPTAAGQRHGEPGVRRFELQALEAQLAQHLRRHPSLVAHAYCLRSLSLRARRARGSAPPPARPRLRR